MVSVRVTTTLTSVSLFTLSALIAGSGCRVSNIQPISFPASYQPEQSGGYFAAPACAMFRELTVEDDRPVGGTDGTRTIQDKEGRADIHVTGDVEAWFKAGVARGMVQSQFPQDSAASLDLTLKLTSIHIEEIAYRNSTFEGHIIIDVELNRRGSGDSVWSRRTDGVSQNYGRPGKAENYQETVNHALDRAVMNALNNEELRQTMCEAKPVTPDAL